MKTKLVLSQWVESDATPRCPVGLVSSGILSVITPGGDRVVDMDIEHVEKVRSVVARGTTENLQKWVAKKHDLRLMRFI